MRYNSSSQNRAAAVRHTAVDGLHLPVDGVPDHQGADKELGPPEKNKCRMDFILGACKQDLQKKN